MYNFIIGCLTFFACQGICFIIYLLLEIWRVFLSKKNPDLLMIKIIITIQYVFIFASFVFCAFNG